MVPADFRVWTGVVAESFPLVNSWYFPAWQHASTCCLQLPVASLRLDQQHFICGIFVWGTSQTERWSGLDPSELVAFVKKLSSRSGSVTSLQSWPASSQLTLPYVLQLLYFWDTSEAPQTFHPPPPRRYLMTSNQKPLILSTSSSRLSTLHRKLPSSSTLLHLLSCWSPELSLF